MVCSSGRCWVVIRALVTACEAVEVGIQVGFSDPQQFSKAHAGQYAPAQQLPDECRSRACPIADFRHGEQFRHDTTSFLHLVSCAFTRYLKVPCDTSRTDIEKCCPRRIGDFRLPSLSRGLQKIVESRWPAWFAERFVEWAALVGATAARERLADAVKQTGLAAIPPSRIRQWSDGRAASAATAFAVGEAFRALPMPFPSPYRSGWVSGPVALWAAGFIQDCVGFFACLAGTDEEVLLVTHYDPDPRLERAQRVKSNGARRVMRFIAPLACLEYGPRLTSQQAEVAASLLGAPVEIALRVAKDECAEAAARGSGLFSQVWKTWEQRRGSPHGFEPEFKKALWRAADMREPDDFEIACECALWHLGKWQERHVSEMATMMIGDAPLEDDTGQILLRKRRDWRAWRLLSISKLD
jgi:hypothetical protein